MNFLRVIVLVLVLLEAGWMVFEGGYALVFGDYLTPAAGAHAGELGPWADLLAGVGIEPRSTAMKVFFVGYGVAWLAVAAAFSIGARWAWWALVIAAAGSLWYLNVGTGVSLLQLGLLMAPQLRS